MTASRVNSVPRSAALIAAVGLVLGLSIGGSPARAAVPVITTLQLTGAQVVPPVETGDYAIAQVSFDNDTSRLTWNFVGFGLQATDVTSIELHRGPKGTNGGLVQTLAGPGTTRGSGSLILALEDVFNLANGFLYIDVHTLSHPDGIIRGQITPVGIPPPPTPTLAPPPPPPAADVSGDSSAPAAVARPAAAPFRGSITPPNTGEAGLAARYIFPAYRAQRYFAARAATGRSAAYGYAGTPRSSR